MCRPISPLSQAALAPALACIRRALDREAGAFSKSVRLTEVVYANLVAKGWTAKLPDYPRMTNHWIDAYLTPRGHADGSEESQGRCSERGLEYREPSVYKTAPTPTTSTWPGKSGCRVRQLFGHWSALGLQTRRYKQRSRR